MEQGRSHDRLSSAVGVAVPHVLLGYAFILGLSLDGVRAVSDTLKVFDVPPEPPLAPREDIVRDTREPEEAAAPPNLRARPSPVVAPPPIVRLDVPPVAAAAAPGSGRDSSAGASDQAGPGTGAGGGGQGSGTGAGIAIRAQQVAGRVADSDYPRAARKAGAEGMVDVRFTIEADGRAHGCAVMRSSGYAELDATTCRLIERRFRFRPARDAQGRPIPEVRIWTQVWWIERRGAAARPQG